MSGPILEPIVLTGEQSEMVDDVIHALKTFRSTGDPVFLADACRSFKVLGEDVLQTVEAPSSS